MLYTINQLYQESIKKVLDVYAVFQDFYKKDYVDLRLKKDVIISNIKNSIISLKCIQVGFTKDKLPKYEVSEDEFTKILENSSSEQVTIYVWWPTVTVTNENDRSVDIQDLYAKIKVQLDGRIPYESMGFYLNKATYTTKQFLSNYLHSHIRAIPMHDFSLFETPCLGHGPIKGTIATLKNDSDEAEWMLFCQELAMYVTVESLTGGPWKRLEEIGNKDLLYSHIGFDTNINIASWCNILPKSSLIDFIKYYIKHGHLSLNFIDNTYVCGLSYQEYIIDLSNAFIAYYNKSLASDVNINRYFTQNLLTHAYLSNNKFYSTGQYNPAHSTSQYQDKYVLTFKGKEIHTKIIEDKSDTPINYITIINHNLAMFILNNILKIINFKYTNNHGNSNISSTTEPSTTTTYKRAIYL